MREDEFIDSLAQRLEGNERSEATAKELREIAESFRSLWREYLISEEAVDLYTNRLAETKRAAAINASEVENLRIALALVEKKLISKEKHIEKMKSHRERIKFRDKTIERLKAEKKELNSRLEHAINELARKNGKIP